MKSIGIHTIISTNFGNRLQNYALQTVLEQICFRKYKVKTIPKVHCTMKQKCKNAVKDIIRKDKEYTFRKFDKRIKWGKSTIAEEDHSHIYPTDLAGVEKEFSAVVIGSDQIWNITFDIIGFNNFLPEILPGKKISYAASFGIKDMPENVTDQITKYLKDIQYVSVRENAGAELYKKLTGRDAEVVLDPTLLLTDKEWSTIATKPVMTVPDKYIFSYFLGDSSYNEETKKYAERFECEIIDINSDNIPVGPEEFLWLLLNSTMICTDSFHASVFSVIFKKPFVVFERKSVTLEMSSRLDTLCDLLKIEHHRYSSLDFNLDLALNDDYHTASLILSREKQRSIKWLENALKNVL